jgi:hypothetical protein
LNVKESAQSDSNLLAEVHTPYQTEHPRQSGGTSRLAWIMLARLGPLFHGTITGHLVNIAPD